MFGIGLSNPRINGPSDYRYITPLLTLVWHTGTVHTNLQPVDDHRRWRTPLSQSLFVTSNASKHQPTACLLARFSALQTCSCAHFLSQECIRMQDLH